MKNHCRDSVGFSFRAALWFLWWFCLREALWDQCDNNDLLPIFTVKCNDSASFSFLFPCFLFFVKDQIASFQLKQNRCFWTKWTFRVCIFFIAWLWSSLITELNLFRVLHAVDSLNVKHELQSKRVRQTVECRHFQTIFLGLPLENRVLFFA